MPWLVTLNIEIDGFVINLQILSNKLLKKITRRWYKIWKSFNLLHHFALISIHNLIKHRSLCWVNLWSPPNILINLQSLFKLSSWCKFTVQSVSVIKSPLCYREGVDQINLVSITDSRDLYYIVISE